MLDLDIDGEMTYTELNEGASKSVNQTEASSGVTACNEDVQYLPKCSLNLSFVQMPHIHSPCHPRHVTLVTLCFFEKTRLKQRYIVYQLRKEAIQSTKGCVRYIYHLFIALRQ